MGVYYNENDTYCAQWLRNLIAAGLIADGEVDERDIRNVPASDVRGFTQCHFFAGIGGWSYALRLAGWPDDKEVWTGSCPCQPFSAAGKQKGFDDERHLWPHWFRLIRECKPSIVFGEQVAHKSALPWLDLVFDNLEGAGYACGASDLCAASVGAPHIRQRLWFVADYEARRRGKVDSLAQRRDEGIRSQGSERSYGSSESSELADIESQHDRGTDTGPRRRVESSDGSVPSELGDAESTRLQEQRRDAGVSRQARGAIPGQTAERTGASTFWSACDWLPCTDGKARPVEPGTQPLAHGIPARVGRLRAYGNAIISQVAAEFIKAYLIEN